MHSYCTTCTNIMTDCVIGMTFEKAGTIVFVACSTYIYIAI